MYFTSTVITMSFFFINIYVVLLLFNTAIYVFLLLWLCIITVCLCMTTLTEVFPCFFLSCKANARVKPQRRGTARTLPSCCVALCIVCVVLCLFVFFVLFVLWRFLYCLCVCVLYYCHRVATQLQLNIYIYIYIYHSSRQQYGVTVTRCCSPLCSWRWVIVTPETCRAVVR
jgi:hypothetical protein